MLCSYMAVLTGTLCALRQILGAEYKLSYGLGGIIAGTTILLESPGRLLELNSYALEKCINSIFVHLRNINVFQGINKGEILYFIPTMALLANSIEKHPHTVHGISEPILRWLFPKTA